MSTILVTGASGFIGRIICGGLMAAGWHTRGALRSHGSIPGLLSGVEGAVVGDIGPDTNWRGALSGVDVVIHMAGLAHAPGVTDYEAYHRPNVLGTATLARQAAEAGVKLFVFASSVKAVGEWNTAPWNEDTPPVPVTAYGRSKLAAERELLDISSKTGMRVFILRLPLVYGPGVKANMANLINAVRKGYPLPLGGIRNLRSMLFTGNLLNAIKIAIDHPPVNGVYFISDGEDVSTRRLVETIGEALGKGAFMLDIPARWIETGGNALDKICGFVGLRRDFGSSMAMKLTGSLTVDISKIRRELVWNPPYNIAEGIRETVKGL